MNSPRFRLAFDYAATLHAADLRKGSRIPYLSHLLEVCAVVLRYYQGLGSKEIADLLELSPPAVDMRLSRARQSLRASLAELVAER